MRYSRPAQPAVCGIDARRPWTSAAIGIAIEYFTTTSHHRFFLQQEGNWITGAHQSELAQQPIVGTVEGDQIKLRSEMRRPGDGILPLFRPRDRRSH
ncbi:MAG: hypothetical protein R2911_30195 [Caldilineaceae bacterium]